MGQNGCGWQLSGRIFRCMEHQAFSCRQVLSEGGGPCGLHRRLIIRSYYHKTAKKQAKNVAPGKAAAKAGASSPGASDGSDGSDGSDESAFTARTDAPYPPSLRGYGATVSSFPNARESPMIRAA